MHDVSVPKGGRHGGKLGEVRVHEAHAQHVLVAASQHELGLAEVHEEAEEPACAFAAGLTAAERPLVALQAGGESGIEEGVIDESRGLCVMQAGGVDLLIMCAQSSRYSFTFAERTRTAR